LKNFTYINAKTLDEAASQLAKGKAWVLAGGTDLLGTMKFSILPDYPQTVINLKTVTPSLDYIKEEGGVLKIGALARLEDIARSGVVTEKYAALAQAAQATASPHIRELGTIGGNICQLNRCWYFRKADNRFDCIRKGGKVCFALTGENRYHSIFGAVSGCVAVNPSDMAPALVALNAKIVTNKQTLDAEKFWAFKVPGSTALAADEIVKEIQVPAPASGVKSAFLKFALRSSIDFPIVNCAAVIGGGGARICLNAVYNTPYRATKAEDAIKGKTIDMTSAEAAAVAGVAGAQALLLNKWKVQVAKAQMKRAILLCEPSGAFANLREVFDAK
jgi:xanthine dehydrogenase YagS FAD-binding subunit